MLFWMKRCAAFDPDFSFYETLDPGFAYALMLFFCCCLVVFLAYQLTGEGNEP